MSNSKRSEAIPLLPTKMGDNKKLVVKRETELWVDDEEDDEVLFADNKKRNTSLVFSDSAILVFQMLQVYCILHSISLRWTWPAEWVVYLRFILFVNLDIWDFMKLQRNGTYQSIQAAHVPSADIGITYWHLMLAWGAVIFIGLLAYIIAYACIRSTHHPYLMVRIAKMQKIYLILFQILAIPFGTMCGRVFHCGANGKVDIDNSIGCNRDTHWAYISPVVAVILLLFVVLPIWMIVRTKNELLSMGSDRHEAYLQLKETEYVHGLDSGYVVGHFHLFASFKKYGSYYRPAVHFCHFVIVALFALAHNHMQIQAISICIILLLMFLGFIIVRPYRLICFNVILVFGYFCLTIDALLGALLSSFTVTTINSAWLTPEYLTYTLTTVQTCFFVAMIVFLIYVISRQIACCPQLCRCCKTPLWPTLTSNRIHKLTPHTQRYVRAVLKARITLEKILEMPPLFAPAHEIGRQIHIINAYCREAELLRDPMLNSLWDLLDELIESHARIAPKSLFAESVKDSIKSTAAELMRIMPQFTARLAQREYDFLLMRPVKRRLLLKMYCLSLFLDNRKRTVIRHRLQEPYLTKVWRPELKDEPEVEETPDDGYYEDMYPEYESPVHPQVYRPETSVGLDLVGLNDLEETETTHNESDKPMTAHTYTNLVFDGDNLSDISSVGEASKHDQLERSLTSTSKIQNYETESSTVHQRSTSLQELHSRGPSNTSLIQDEDHLQTESDSKEDINMISQLSNKYLKTLVDSEANVSLHEHDTDDHQMTQSDSNVSENKQQMEETNEAAQSDKSLANQKSVILVAGFHDKESDE